MIFNGKNILITGGTGSLGKCLIRRILSGYYGTPNKIVIFSRDEAKQHQIRVDYMKLKNPTEEVIYNNFKRLIEFRIGDVRNYSSVCSALKGVDIVIHAAALKQVPSCEYFPSEAALTNISGIQNIVRAIDENNLPVKHVLAVSTDKACKPVNSYGMTKALQERITTTANILLPNTSFISVRYGNVLASRGSVIPFFHEQIKNGGPVTVTTADMTRFFFSLDEAVEVVIAALENSHPGDIYVPRIPAFLMSNIAKTLVGDRDILIKCTGIRPGEKEHEEMVSDVEAPLAYTKEVEVLQKDGSKARKNFHVIMPMLPELQYLQDTPFLTKAYTSLEDVSNLEDTLEMLKRNDLLLKD